MITGKLYYLLSLLQDIPEARFLVSIVHDHLESEGLRFSRQEIVDTAKRLEGRLRKESRHVEALYVRQFVDEFEKETVKSLEVA